VKGARVSPPARRSVSDGTAHRRPKEEITTSSPVVRDPIGRLKCSAFTPLRTRGGSALLLSGWAGGAAEAVLLDLETHQFLLGQCFRVEHLLEPDRVHPLGHPVDVCIVAAHVLAGSLCSLVFARARESRLNRSPGRPPVSRSGRRAELRAKHPLLLFERPHHLDQDVLGREIDLAQPIHTAACQLAGLRDAMRELAHDHVIVDR
jgi:hypothetical protein